MKKELIVAAFLASSSMTGLTIASAQFDTDITFGASGQSVKDLQAFLTKRSFFSGEVTGTFGPRTREALRRYQKSKGLQTGGTFVGTTTRRLMIDDQRIESGEKNREEKDIDDRNGDHSGRATSTLPVLIPVSTPTNTGIRSTIKTKTVSSTVHFDTPGGMNSLTLTVSSSTGVISDVIYSVKANDAISQNYANNFTSALSKTSLVGKTISNVSFSRIGGASLTTHAFMNALENVQGNI